MKHKQTLLAAAAACAALVAVGYGAYRFGMTRGMDMAPTSSSGQASEPSAVMSIAQGEAATRRHIASGLKAGDVDPATGKKILYYHDPMMPATKFDKPAKSPFMDMMLVPVFADAGSGDSEANQVSVSPRTQQNLGVRSAPVVAGVLAPQVTALGSIGFNEGDQVVVQARTTGFVEKLHVRALLDRVTPGQVIAELYVPEWIAAQEEFLGVSRMQGADLAPLVDAARQRMRQVGMSDSQIALVQVSGRTQPRFEVSAPIGGVLSELLVREGMTVMAGTTLFRINGLASVWANAEVPESQAALLRPGARVQARSPALPGAVFEGRLQALLPEVNAVTRTVKARLALANRNGALVPGMFVQMQFMDPRAGKVLLVPTEAVIQTGQRTLVMLAEEDGRFRPVEVEIGAESGGSTEVKRGLRLGQRVVVSSQFLIDSEASLKGVEARLNVAPAMTPGDSGSRSAPTPPNLPTLPKGSKP
jgi:membrane fusion protein, copper/silver efflux system